MVRSKNLLQASPSALGETSSNLFASEVSRSKVIETSETAPLLPSLVASTLISPSFSSLHKSRGVQHYWPPLVPASFITTFEPAPSFRSPHDQLITASNLVGLQSIVPPSLLQVVLVAFPETDVRPLVPSESGSLLVPPPPSPFLKNLLLVFVEEASTSSSVVKPSLVSTTLVLLVIAPA